MFVGHFGVAFAGKKIAPRVGLGTLFAAAQLPDLLWPVFLALGWERVAIAPGDTAVTPLRFESYPYSHSLVAMILWGLAFASIYWVSRRDRRGALVLLGLVLSHWLLDWASHRPDMPLWPGSPRFGAGLWNSRALTLVVESLLFSVGVVLYARSRGGFSLRLLVLAGLLVLFYASAFFGPPPPSVRALIAVGILGAVILLPLAAWVDRAPARS
jgi:hypothetical protein